MPNILGKSTLREVAVRTEVSPSWLNKIQNTIGIGGKTGVRGNKTSFSDDDMEMFRKVKTLRALDFDIKEIKKIYELEKEMISISGGHESKNRKAYSDNDKCFILHPYSYSIPIFEKVDGSKLTKAEGEKYGKNSKMLNQISEEIMHRVNKNLEDLKSFVKMISGNVK